MRVVILGSTGMLGHTVKEYLKTVILEHELHFSSRQYPKEVGEFHFEVVNYPNEYHLCVIPECDYIINCIGLIKPFVPDNISMAIMANALFPHRLADYCESRDMKLINITTDCVYSGKKGNYTENDPSDAEDAYGKTKSLGEPKNCMNLRTSIVGPELGGKATSLVEIVKRNKGKEFSAFTNWYWSGVTTKQYAKICYQIMEEDLYQAGTFHVFSDRIVKGEMITILNAKYDLNMDIRECEAPYFCDRTLSTVKDLNGKLNIPSIRDQMKEM